MRYLITLERVTQQGMQQLFFRRPSREQQETWPCCAFPSIKQICPAPSTHRTVLKRPTWFTLNVAFLTAQSTYCTAHISIVSRIIKCTSILISHPSHLACLWKVWEKEGWWWYGRSHFSRLSSSFSSRDSIPTHLIYIHLNRWQVAENVFILMAFKIRSQVAFHKGEIK